MGSTLQLTSTSLALSGHLASARSGAAHLCLCLGGPKPSPLQSLSHGPEQARIPAWPFRTPLPQAALLPAAWEASAGQGPPRVSRTPRRPIRLSLCTAPHFNRTPSLSQVPGGRGICPVCSSWALRPLNGHDGTWAMEAHGGQEAEVGRAGSPQGFGGWKGLMGVRWEGTGCTMQGRRMGSSREREGARLSVLGLPPTHPFPLLPSAPAPQGCSPHHRLPFPPSPPAPETPLPPARPRILAHHTTHNA